MEIKKRSYNEIENKKSLWSKRWNKFWLKWKNIIFAPNGVGKTSITKGFKGLKEKIFKTSLEGTVNKDFIQIDIKSNQIFIIDENFLDEIKNSENSDLIKNQVNKKIIFSINSDLHVGYFKIIEKVFKELKIKYSIFFDNKEIDNQSEISKIIKKIVNNPNKNIEEIKDIENKILLKSPKHIDKDLFDKIKLYKNKIDAIKKATKVDKRIKFNKLDDKVGKYFNKNLDRDFPLIKNINESGSLNFQYKYENHWIDIKNAEENLKEKFNENGISKLNRDAYLALRYLKGNHKEIEKLSTRGIAELKIAENFLIEMWDSLIIGEFKKYQDQLQIEHKKIINENKNFVKNYNEIAKEINEESLKINALMWTIKIKEIKNYYEETNIVFENKNNSKTISKDELNEYGSNGQRKILYLIIALIEAKEKDFIVIDDPVSSLDLDNINIFIEIINNFDKNKNILILTHNYHLLSNFAIAKNNDNTKFFFMDSYSQADIIVKEININVLKKMSKWLTTNFKKDKNLDKCSKETVLMFATILREITSNYFLNAKSKEEKKDLEKLKDFIDQNYRHWRSNSKSFFVLVKEIKEIAPMQLINLLQENNSPLNFLFKNKSIKEKTVSDFILNYKHKSKNEIESFFDYVLNKYMLTMQIRFQIEKKVILSLSENKINEWNNGKFKGLMNIIEKEKLEIEEEWKNIYNRLNFVNHINNLRWAPMIEMPLHKIMQYRKIVGLK